MGITRILSISMLTFSVTAWAQTPKLVSPTVDMAFSKTPGLWRAEKGFATIDGEKLIFTVQGQISDQITVNRQVEVRALKLFSYMNYSARAADELNRGPLQKRTPEIYFYRPVVLVQYPAAIMVYAVDIAGEFTLLASAPAKNARPVRAIVSDPSGVLRGIDLDLIQFDSGASARYYSPELKGFVNRSSIERIKEDGAVNDISIGERIELSTFNAKAADDLAAAEEELRNTRFIFTSESEKSSAVTSAERAVRHTEVQDALLPRRLLDRARAMSGRVVSGSEKSELLRETMSKFVSALNAAAEALSKRLGAATDCAYRLRRRI